MITQAEIISKRACDDETPLSELSQQAEALAAGLEESLDTSGDEIKYAQLKRAGELTAAMQEYREKGLRNEGVSTGWPGLDEYYRPARGTLNIITGIPSHGKSSFIDALAVNISLCSKWRWAVFSPENYPIELHLQKLIELFIGKNLRHETTPDELTATMKWIDLYFQFVQLTEASHNLQALLRLLNKPVKAKEIDAVIIDPWNELDVSLKANEKETDFIGRSLSRLRRFARRHDIAVFVVAHPAKMYKPHGEDRYDVPTLYAISGSAEWYNKADNGLCVYRDFSNDIIDLHIQKIKFKIHGKVGAVSFKYDKTNGRFTET